MSRHFGNRGGGSPLVEGGLVSRHLPGGEMEPLQQQWGAWGGGVGGPSIPKLIWREKWRRCGAHGAVRVAGDFHSSLSLIQVGGEERIVSCGIEGGCDPWRFKTNQKPYSAHFLKAY